jgi:SPASM domain peptide maturase of grasp-with-spasm system
VKDNKTQGVFRLHANCIPVKGARRSLICDLQNSRYRLIPNALYEILTEMKGWETSRIQGAVSADGQVLDGYFEQLVREEYGAYYSDASNFPDLDLRFEMAGTITNAIIDVDGGSAHDYSNIFEQLDGLGCQAIQVRCFSGLPLDAIESLIVAGEGRGFRHMDLLLCYTEALTEEALRRISSTHPTVSRVLVHSAPMQTMVEQETYIPTILAYFTGVLSSANCCGAVDSSYFSPNIFHFTEAMQCNSCLNQKVSISTDGSIRNCPSMPSAFGNARYTRLADAVAVADFKVLWNTTKDAVKVCRDCEFRYICTDCRAHLSDSSDPLSKPAKCNYDPYTATWVKRPPVQIESVSAAPPAH